MFSLLFKNISKFIKHKPLLFTFLILSQIACVIGIIFVCALMDNAFRSEEIIQEGEKQFNITLIDYSLEYTYKSGEHIYNEPYEIPEEEQEKFNNSKYADGYFSDISKMKDLKPKIEEFIDFLGDDFETLSIMGKVNEARNSEAFSSGYPVRHDNISDELNEFHFSKDKIVRLDPNEYAEEYGKDLKVGDKIKLNGIEYEVAMLENNVAYINIPYAALQDDFLCTIIWVDTKEVCSAERCDEINKKIEELFETDNYYPPQPVELEELQNINMAYGVTAAVILMALLNISRIYTYILSYRKKSFAVMSICGASKGKIFAMYLIELLLTLAVTYCVGVLAFDKLILPPMGAAYPNFLKFISPEVYLNVFGIYFVIALIIMSLTISMFMTKTSVDMERSGK